MLSVTQNSQTIWNPLVYGVTFALYLCSTVCITRNVSRNFSNWCLRDASIMAPVARLVELIPTSLMRGIQKPSGHYVCSFLEPRCGNVSLLKYICPLRYAKGFFKKRVNRDKAGKAQEDPLVLQVVLLFACLLFYIFFKLIEYKFSRISLKTVRQINSKFLKENIYRKRKPINLDNKLLFDSLYGVKRMSEGIATIFCTGMS